MYDCIDMFNLLFEAGFLPFNAHGWFKLTCMGPVPAIFVSSVGRRESDVIKNMEMTSTREDRLPEIFKIHARFLVLFFRSLIPSTIGLLETDGKIWQTLFTNAWLWVQFPRKIIHSRWKSTNQYQFRFIGNASHVWLINRKRFYDYSIHVLSSRKSERNR